MRIHPEIAEILPEWQRSGEYRSARRPLQKVRGRDARHKPCTLRGEPVCRNDVSRKRRPCEGVENRPGQNVAEVAASFRQARDNVVESCTLPQPGTLEIGEEENS